MKNVFPRVPEDLLDASAEAAARAESVASAAPSGSVFHVVPQGRLANQMIQYMLAIKFASLVPGCRISNVDLPDWEISLPPTDIGAPCVTWTDAHRFEMDLLAERMRAGEIQNIQYEGFGQRMENFLDRSHYQSIFQAPQYKGVGYGPNHLVCHIRAGDVLTAPHREYVLTPVAFYQEIVARTGLLPVFIGETEPGPYMNQLREGLPQAIVLPRGDIIHDFEIIRQSKNILVSCSTFCWLAAWLSDADRIFLPVNGLLNPRQDHRIDLLPFGDPRYHFFLFPVNYAVPEVIYADRHRALTGMWREIPHDRLRHLLTGPPRVPHRIDRFLELFDETFYRAHYKAVREALAEGRFSSGLDHYRERGFNDGQRGFAFDEGWYTWQYPMAAFEVAHGDYHDTIHHYAEIGRTRGYKPMPPRLRMLLWAWKLRFRRAVARLAKARRQFLNCAKSLAAR